MKDLLSNVGAGGAGPATGAPAAAGGAAASADAPAEEEKKEEEKEESDDDMVRYYGPDCVQKVINLLSAGLRSFRLISTDFMSFSVVMLSFSPLLHRCTCTTRHSGRGVCAISATALYPLHHPCAHKKIVKTALVCYVRGTLRVGVGSNVF